MPRPDLSGSSTKLRSRSKIQLEVSYANASKKDGCAWPSVWLPTNTPVRVQQVNKSKRLIDQTELLGLHTANGQAWTIGIDFSVLLEGGDELLNIFSTLLFTLSTRY